jgi:hypothetical protein
MWLFENAQLEALRGSPELSKRLGWSCGEYWEEDEFDILSRTRITEEQLDTSQTRAGSWAHLDCDLPSTGGYNSRRADRG